MLLQKPKPIAPTAPPHSEATEDHLERIAELVEQKGYARVTDLAEVLNLTTSAVSNMVRRLADRGLVNYERYRGFTLTGEGQAIAQKIRDRHHTLTELFTLMGLEEDTVQHEVEGMEHHLSPQTLGLLGKLVSYWRAYPAHLGDFLRHVGE